MRIKTYFYSQWESLKKSWGGISLIVVEWRFIKAEGNWVWQFGFILLGFSFTLQLSNQDDFE